VVLTDVRDVVFQRDPFDEMETRVNGSYFVFSLESQRLGHPGGANIQMYETVFLSLPSVAAQAENATNCGFRMGSADMVLSYIAAMFHLRDTEAAPHAPYICSDQAVQQRLAYERQELFGETGAVMFTGNDDSVVHTMHYEVPLAYRHGAGGCRTAEGLDLQRRKDNSNVRGCRWGFDANGRFVSWWNKVPAVLHQFDRDPMLDKIFMAQLIDVPKSSFEILQEAN
jgi:hypothetical protein